MNDILLALRLREIAKDLEDDRPDLASELRVMSKALAGPTLRKYAIQHIDGDPRNNEPANLRLVTIKENMR